ncbi:SDR family NAD(P)-dependent oxidoreductase [Glycomyces dulcitolivorans]|uniref:SDR family NAD(P)-dependent oxidoreductase n=1 Tax=Glycomyces dulcitolivorans TaxID=2200759 RepID=UPI000DD3EF34|nr:SDR family NAD(P)-dependent oxidoreductase [Glycomyces dulcitolivorans]
MKTIVITGGTDGIGAALARHRLALGDRVVVIGRDAAKGEALGAEIIAADLSLVAEQRRVVDLLASQYEAIDALVLCARYFRSHRHLTPDGFEACFALEYLSRFQLSHGLLDRLEAAAAPVVLNVSGPGAAKPEIRWGDLGFRRGYSGMEAQFHAGRANDLLGLGFAAEHPKARTRYVMVNPGGVASSFAGEYDPQTAAMVEQMKRTARPVDAAAPPLSAFIDKPPAKPLSAFVIDRPVSPRTTPDDDAAAERLQRLTLEALGR